jgi:hypothetical protein
MVFHGPDTDSQVLGNLRVGAMTGQGGYLNFPDCQRRVAAVIERHGLIFRRKSGRKHGICPVHCGCPNGVVDERIPIESTSEEHPYLVKVGVGLVVLEQHTEQLVIFRHNRSSNCHKLIV